MTTVDPFAEFKSIQRVSWGLFTPVEIFTAPAAAKLVNYANLKPGQRVLDVGCGTGVVAIAAARKAASVMGLDLSPTLLERARWNANLAKVEINFIEGDVEALPYPNDEFDVVLSQFGHMFAPRPDIAIAEMLRVLKPGGTLAFATWPPELFTGRMFALTAKHFPPPPGVAPPQQWGHPDVIKERLGNKVGTITFERELLMSPSISPQHFRNFIESTVGPVVKLKQSLGEESKELKSFRADFDLLINEYFENSAVRQHFIMTKAQKI